MKKILAVLIAISMVATMAFAADFSFEVKTEGDILNWDTTKDAATLISRKDNALKVELKAAVEDTAGVEVTLKNKTVAGFDSKGFDDATADAEYDGDLSEFYTSNSYIVASSAAIWIKPVDGVKLTFGEGKFNAAAVADFDNDSDHNADVYGEVKGDGFTVDYDGIENLTVTVALKKGISTKALDAADLIAAKVAYKIADAATVAVTADNKLNAAAAVSGSVSPVDYVAVVEYKNEKVTVAEKATLKLAPVTVWEAVEYKVADSKLIALEELTLDLAPVTVTQTAAYRNEKISAGVKAAATVSVVTCELAANTADVEAIADNVTLKATVKADLKGNVGSAAWKVTPKCTVDILQDFKVAVEVPYSVTIAF